MWRTLFMLSTMCVLSSPVVAQDVPSASRIPAASAQQLQRDLDLMKQQLQQMQDKIRQQEEANRETQYPRSAPCGDACPCAPAAGDANKLKQEVREEVLRDIQPQLSAANKTFPSQFNPAIGLILDSAFTYRQHEGNNFEFRAAELGLSASIDPFCRGYAVITGSPSGFDVEEAAIVTTSLPYNLTVKGGVSLRTSAGSRSPRPRSAVCESAGRARPLHRRRITCGRRRGERSPADRAVCDPHGRHVQQARDE